MKTIRKFTAAALVATSTLSAFGDEAANKALQERIHRDMRTKAEMDHRATAEKYRDKTHDNRLQTGPNSSLGITGGPKLDFKWKF